MRPSPLHENRVARRDRRALLLRRVPRARGLLGAAAVVAVGLLGGCVDAELPSASEATGSFPVALSPYFSPSAATTSANAGPITALRLRALVETGDGATRTLAERVVTPVDPNASSWDVDFEIPVPEEGGSQVILTIELMSVDGNGDFVVEFSGVQRGIDLSSPLPRIRVPVGRGPLSNQALTSLTVSGAAPMRVNDVLTLQAALAPANLNPAPVVFWTSSNPGVAAVGATSGVVSALAPGTTTITAVAGSVSDEVEIQVRPGESGLSVTTSVVPEEGAPGDEVTWRVEVSNAGPDRADGVTVQGAFSPALEVASAEVSAGTLTSEDGSGWQIGNLPAEGSATLIVTGTLPDDAGDGESFTRTATVQAGPGQQDPDPSDNSASASVVVRHPRADLSLSATLDRNAVDPGDPLVFTLSLTNQGPAAAAAAQVTTTLPDGFVVSEITPAPGAVVVTGDASGWQVTDLAVGEVVELSVSGTVDGELDPETILEFGAQVTLADGQVDPDASNDAAGASARVRYPQADLVLANSAQIVEILPGRTFEFYLRVHNDGPETASQVVVRPGVPDGLVLESLLASGGRVAGGIWTLPTLAPGEGGEVLIGVRVPDDAEPGSVLTITSTVSSDGSTEDPTPADNGTALVVVVQEPLHQELEIIPGTSERLVGGTQQFSVLDGPGGPYIWSVAGVDGGTVTFGTITSSGYYSAPSQVPSPATFEVCARVQAMQAQRGCADVTIVAIPSEGADLVVVNDVNPFDNNLMGRAGNQQFVRNLVNFSQGGPRASGNKVWLDAGRASRWLSPGGSGVSTMQGVISDLGLTPVVVTSDAGQTSLFENVPSDVKVIFLFTPTVGFTREEVNGLKVFAAQGGRIVFIGEHNGFYGSWIPLENQFLQDMGAQMTNVGALLDCGTRILPASSLSAHPIMSGVTDMTVACSSRIVLGPNDFALYLDTSGQYVLAAVGKIDTTPLPPPVALRSGELRGYPGPDSVDPSVTTHGTELMRRSGGN